MNVSSQAVAQPFAAVLMDARSGEILYETDNSNARLHPASLTKMMTLYVAFEALQNNEISLDTRVTISRHAASQPPSRLGLRAGQTIAFRYLIRAAALRSGNDAAAAIGEAIEGSVSAYAARMNRTARAIGMTRTNFHNQHGLTQEGHLSSARDMTILGRQLFFDYPQYYNIFSRMSEDAGVTHVNNTNRLFLSSYRGADGIKTGFTNAAGYNLTAMAERNGVRLIVTVFGARSSQDRARRVSQLMDRGFGQAPARVAVNRPSQPNYVRGSDDRGNGPAAGRVIRLQTAPTSSRFPRPRPRPGDAPSADMIAALRDTIDSVIEEIREPEVLAAVTQAVASAEAADDPDMPDMAEVVSEAVAVAIASAAPERSPLPPSRRAAEVVTLAQAAEAAGAEEGPGVEVTRGIADPIRYAAVLPEDESDTSAENPLVAALAGGPTTAPPESRPAAVPLRLEIAAPADPAPQPAGEAPVLLAALEPVPSDLSVDDSGRILWRDEELLGALAEEDPEEPVLAPTIVLTSAADTAPAPVAAPAPEIVTRVSTSGGRLWRVELGRYNSTYAAERELLGVALSEAATLGNGVRRVANRGGRHVAEVNSLTQEEAQLACARLNARGGTCDVVGPDS